MKTTAHNQTSQLMDRFASSQLNSYEMFSVRGGEEKEKDLSDQGSTAPKQDDGFN
jgi:hypothetical protein